MSKARYLTCLVACDMRIGMHMGCITHLACEPYECPLLVGILRQAAHFVDEHHLESRGLEAAREVEAVLKLLRPPMNPCARARLEGRLGSRCERWR